MYRRTLALVVLSIAVAAGCVSLGLWQLRRLGERRAWNAGIAARLEQSPVVMPPIARADSLRYRRVRLTGVYDFARELAYGPASRAGSPGINFLTPMRLAGTDTAVLVNRGWVYAADAATADFARWRERDTASVVGYVREFEPARAAVRAASRPRFVRRMDRDSIAAALPYPLAPFYVVATGDTAVTAPARLTAPPLDDGPHRGYAIQWFAFALIAVVGAGAVRARDRR